MVLKILLVEDDENLAQFLSSRLINIEQHVVVASSCQQAYEISHTEHFDIYILDRMLPDGDSFDWLKRKRDDNDHTPAIFLTALNSVADKVTGLSAADDYLAKPFEFDELWARVQALSRRQPMPADAHLYFGPLTIDRLNHSASIQQTALKLKPKEFALLDYFVQKSDTIVTRKMLLQAVWGFEFDPTTNIVETYISRLRQCLKENGNQIKIETVRKSGYRLVIN